MKIDCYIGIDPGQSGGIAAVLTHTAVVTPMPMAGKELDVGVIVEWLKWLHELVGEDSTVACIEKVHAMPTQGVSSTFKFGKNFGIMIGIIGALNIPLHMVTPNTWKKKILVGTARDKAAAIDYCRRVYPEVNLLATPRSRQSSN